MTSTLDARPTAPDGPATPDDPAVLVTGAGGPAGIAVIRRLMARGHRVVGRRRRSVGDRLRSWRRSAPWSRGRTTCTSSTP